MAIFEANNVMVIVVEGGDAAKIVNNLTTNKIADLAPGESCETFVTNIKGWCVAHCIAVKTDSGINLVGMHPDPASVATHIDRYIISEDAEVTDRSAEFRLVFAEEAAELCFATLVASASLFSPAGAFGLCPLDQDLPEQMNQQTFDGSRVENMWPIMGIDISEKTIPQEADRDESAISFTKGCYLGQETIARLDARGRLQRKLCRLKLNANVEVGTEILSGEKSVGHVSTVGTQNGEHIGLAILKRGAFDIGTELTTELGVEIKVY